MPSPLELWLTAIKSPKGIIIDTNDRTLLRNQLYKVRREAKNPILDIVCIIFPKEPKTELWIVHKNADEK